MSVDSAFRATIRLHRISREFLAGVGNCTAGVAALTDASVEIRGGEVLVVCGPPGSGKTTLLLCTAGMLHFDSGEIERGERRVVYRDLARDTPAIDGWPGRSAILLDSCDDVGALLTPRVARIIAGALDSGSAIVLAGRDATRCLDLAPPSATVSIVHLRLGRIVGRRGEIGAVHRVAEAGGGSY